MIDYLNGKTVANKKLRGKYTFPPVANVRAEGGQNISHDLVLQRK